MIRNDQKGCKIDISKENYVTDKRYEIPYMTSVQYVRKENTPVIEQVL